MKKILLLFFIAINIVFSLEIKNIDPLDFGEVVAGDREVSLKGIGVYVEGEPSRKVLIEVPKFYNFEGNTMRIKVQKKEIVLDSSGRGKFKLNVELKLNNTKKYTTLADKLNVEVRYIN